MINPTLDSDQGYRDLVRRAAQYFEKKLEKGEDTPGMIEWMQDYKRVQLRELHEGANPPDKAEIEVPL